IAFTSTAPATATVGTTYAPTATGGASGNPVTFSVDPASASVFLITASTVSFTGTGSCILDADQAGNTDYAAAAQQQQTITVGQGSQAIAFTSTAPTTATVGTTYVPTGTGGAPGKPGTFTSATPLVCTVSGSMVSFTGAGTWTGDADQAGNADYGAAPTATQNVSVGQGSQAITFTSMAPATATVGTTYAPTAAGGASGNPVTSSVDPASTSVCLIPASTVSFTGTGSCILDADQAGNTDYAAAAQQQQTITVGQGSQAIAFTSTAPTAATFGGTSAPTATGGASGNPVTFTSATPLVCTVSGSTVSFTGAGTCTVDADQAGNTDYQAAPTATQNVSVGQGSQAIAFTSTAPATATVGTTNGVAATGGASGNPVTI